MDMRFSNEEHAVLCNRVLNNPEYRDLDQVLKHKWQIRTMKTVVVVVDADATTTATM